MDCTVTIKLIRHAKTQSNIERKYLGWTDEEILSQKLPIIDENIATVYGSDLMRCYQTAQAYFPNAHYVADRRFRESCFGVFELKTYEQLKQEPSYRRWIDAPDIYAPQNGETLNQLYERTKEALIALPNEQIVHIVAHGGSIRAILCQFGPTPSAFWDWSVQHDMMYVLKFDSYEQLKEGRRCTSLSVVPITASAHT